MCDGGCISECVYECVDEREVVAWWGRGCMRKCKCGCKFVGGFEYVSVSVPVCLCGCECVRV